MQLKLGNITELVLTDSTSVTSLGTDSVQSNVSPASVSDVTREYVSLERSGGGRE